MKKIVKREILVVEEDKDKLFYNGLIILTDNKYQSIDVNSYKRLIVRLNGFSNNFDEVNLFKF